MFNQGIFNQQSFNLLGNNSSDVDIKESMVETLYSLIAYGEDIHEIPHYNSHFQANLYLTPSDMYRCNMSEITQNMIDVFPQYNLVASVSESLNTDIQPSKDSYIIGACKEETHADVFLSFDAYYTIKFNSQWLNYAFGSKNYHEFETLLFTIVNCSISSYIFNYYTISIDVTIPPNGVLIIDSDNYNVLLGDTNVIEKQSGDWLDNLSRNTFDVEIDSGVSGNLRGSLLYTERYL